MAIRVKLSSVFEDSFLCNVPKMSAFATLLGTGKPIFTTGIICKEKKAFPILRYIIVHTNNCNESQILRLKVLLTFLAPELF